MQIKDMTDDQIKDALIRGQNFLLQVPQMQQEVNALNMELLRRLEEAKKEDVKE